jgi:hypothetical protein
MCLDELETVPLTGVKRLGEDLTSPKKLVPIGFGAGLAWSAIAIKTDRVTVFP